MNSTRTASRRPRRTALGVLAGSVGLFLGLVATPSPALANSSGISLTKIGSGTMVTVSAGTLTLSGNNTYTGATP